jgi:uncharacterized membrane protein YphA (DoxX/SURF4 family)
MASVFPELFNYSQLAPFILRVALALILAQTAFLSEVKSPDKKEKIIGIIKILSAIFILIGMLTQIAAMIIAILALFRAVDAKIKKIVIAPERKLLDSLIFVISISLILSGPGLFSIDLPL